jgi:hypothetical protein
MTEADPDAISPDGTVRLRCYLPLADSLWFVAACQGREGCGRAALVAVLGQDVAAYEVMEVLGEWEDLGHWAFRNPPGRPGRTTPPVLGP